VLGDTDSDDRGPDSTISVCAVTLGERGSPEEMSGSEDSDRCGVPDTRGSWDPPSVVVPWGDGLAGVEGAPDSVSCRAVATGVGSARKTQVNRVRARLRR
jgi:hypothetical protein